MKSRINILVNLVGAVAVTMFLSSCSTSKISMNRAELDRISTIAIMKFDAAPGIPAMIVTECEEAFRGHFLDVGKGVVERAKLRTIMREVERSQSGLVSSSEEIGRLSGAQALMFGTITRNGEETRLVDYIEYVKNPATKETEKIKKTRKKKFYSFQIQGRLVSTSTGAAILTIKNENPERSYEMTDSMTLNRFRENVLAQMGKDLKKALEKK